MKRRVLALCAIASLAATGCATLDSDVAASVNGTELTVSQLAEELGVEADDPELISAGRARAAINEWIVGELETNIPELATFAEVTAASPFETDIACLNIVGSIDESLAAELADGLNDGGSWPEALAAVGAAVGQPIPNEGYAGCNSTAAAFGPYAEQVRSLSPDQAFATVTTPDAGSFLVRLTPADEVPAEERIGIVRAAGLEDAYNAGTAESGVVCASHILVATVEEAEEVNRLLDDGASFAEVAADRSIDPGSAAQGGSLGCREATEFATTFIPPFVDAALAADVGVPTGPVESDFGVHVILLRPFDGLSLAELASALPAEPLDIREIAADADIEVSPTYGYFDLDQGVLPLG